MSSEEFWWKEPALIDIVGYDVEALDGDIGQVAEATDDLEASYVVVETRARLPTTKVMLPAGIVDRIDHFAERVYVGRTKDEIRNAPSFDERTYATPLYRLELGRYYGPGGAGYRVAWADAEHRPAK